MLVVHYIGPGLQPAPVATLLRHLEEDSPVRLPVELLVVKVGELEYLGKMGQQVGCLDKALVHLAWPVRVGSMAPQGWRVHQEA